MRASRALVYATAAALPAFLLPVHLGPLSTTALEIAVVVTAVVYGVEVYASGVRPRWPGAFTGPMLLVLVALPVAVAISPDRKAAAEVVRTSFLEPAALFGVACSVLTGPREMGRFVRAMLLGGGAVAVMVLAVFAHAAATGQADILAAPPIAWYPRAASAGLLLTPLIALAGALVLMLPGPLLRADRVGPGLFLAVALPAAVLTLSQAAWLALGATVFALTLAITHGRRRRVLGVVVPTMAALGMAALLAAPARSSLANEIRTGGGPVAGVDSRAQLWSDAVSMVQAHPLEGVGVGVLGSRAAVGEPVDVAHRDDPSNLMLAIWLRLGLVGVAGLVWFAARVVRWLLAVRAASAEVRPFVVGAACALLAVLAGGVLDTSFASPDLAVMTLGVCALIATAARLQRVRLRALVRFPLPGAAADIEAAELPMPADIPRRTGRFPAARPPAAAG
jgi:O-Antigen ligase